MGKNKLQLNLDKNGVAISGGSLSGGLSSLVLDGVALPQIDPVCILGVLLNTILVQAAGGNDD